jgi:hypothetical protein
MANKAFLLPFVIAGTRHDDEKGPDEFPGGVNRKTD